MKRARKPLANDRGVVLVTALMVMALLTVIGMAALNTSDTELQISGNQRLATQSFYLAEAGIQHAVGVFRGSNDNGALTAIQAIAGTDRPLGGGSYNVTSTAGNPPDPAVERVRLVSTGTVAGVSKRIEATYSRVRRNNNPDGAFAIYGDNPTLNLPNNKKPIDGRDWGLPNNFDCSGAGCSGSPTGGAAQPGLYISDPTFTDPGKGLEGDPPFRNTDGHAAEDWQELAQALIPLGNKNPPANNLGTREQPTISYFDRQTSFSGNVHGSGILIIEKTGDLKFGGTFHYEGIVIVLENGGIDTFSGTSDLFGAVIMVGDNVNTTFGGSGMAKFSRQALANVQRLMDGRVPNNNRVNREAWRERDLSP